MKNLYWFNPENDLALAANTPYFTPPRAAVTLREVGKVLPVWYSGNDSYIVGDDTTKHFVDWLQQHFDITTRVLDVVTDDTGAVYPWGWSQYTVFQLRRMGVDDALLPTQQQLDSYRQLSHRRLTINVYKHLNNCNLPYPLPPLPREIDSIRQVAELLEQGQHMFLKSPLSGSGRGIIDTTTAPPRQVLRLVEGVIKHQGSIMLEKRLDKVLDFAMLFDMVDGVAEFRGFSSFFTASYSIYNGNDLMTDDAIFEKLSTYVDTTAIRATERAIISALTGIIGQSYSGPLGVDMMIYRSGNSYFIAPCVEVNLRMTMGRVAHSIARCFLYPGVTGRMVIKHLSSQRYEPLKSPHIEQGRLLSGNLPITPLEGHDIAIVVETD